MSIFVPPRFVVPLAPVVKAGPLGPGAGPMLTEFPLSSIFGARSVQQKMRQAAMYGVSVPWIRAAEMTITGPASTTEWHLEDAEDVEIDDKYPGDIAQEARLLIEKPQANLALGVKQTRREIWAQTLRLMGLTGNAFWLMDEPNAYGTPRSILPIVPWRMYPEEDANGNLTAWYVAPSGVDQLRNLSDGYKIPLDQIAHFILTPPDEGHFGIGLVESAIMKLGLSTALDKHLSQVLSAGGRLSGFLSPKTGDALSNDQYQQLINDFRTIVEQPDAAKRLQVLRGPVDFTPTTMSPQELQITNLIQQSKEDLLAIWGVPLSQIGGSTPAGMNSGDTRKYDEAALWQNAIHPRLTAFVETVQYQLLDRYAAQGVVVELEVEEPEFDDDSPRYDLLSKSINITMTNSERRALIGLDPFGEDVLDNGVWLPATLVEAFTVGRAPEPSATSVALGRAGATVQDAEVSTSAADAAGETSTGDDVVKASGGFTASLAKIRERLDAAFTPKIRKAVASVLADQKAEIATRLREYSDHIAANPQDTRTWFDKAKWDRRMTEALRPQVAGIAGAVNAHVAAVFEPKKASPLRRTAATAAALAAEDAALTAAEQVALNVFESTVLDRVLKRGAARVSDITDTTMRDVQKLILRGIEQGLSPAAVGDLIEGLPGAPDTLGKVISFDEYRAERIARTEMMDAYNTAAIESYRDADVTMVEATDGDDDPECAERNGQVFSIDEAESIEDHPNGTLDWTPYFAEPKARTSGTAPHGSLS